MGAGRKEKLLVLVGDTSGHAGLSVRSMGIKTEKSDGYEVEYYGEGGVKP